MELLYEERPGSCPVIAAGPESIFNASFVQ